MAGIQGKINSLKPYIIGIRIVEGVQLVDASFKKDWVIPPSKDSKIQREVVDKDKNYYMFFSSEPSVTFDDLLEVVENIINMNIEREVKFSLLNENITKLQHLFNNNTLDKLKTLKIGFDSSLEPSVVYQPKLNDIKFNNEDSISEDVIEEVVREPEVIEAETNMVNHNGQQIELPPRNIPPNGTKIVLEDYSLPEELTTGECDCNEFEACGKCLDRK